jgi:D-alanyl-lipoteichoic acid acyltransferase DltB (MBOAT superfamily)
MLFSSYIFLFVFLPVTLTGFCLLSRLLGTKPAKLWLTLASLVFYGWWNPAYVALIVVSMLFNFWLGKHIGRAVRAGGAGRGGTGDPDTLKGGLQRGQAWLVFGVTANLLLLGYFKYANFFVGNINAVFGTGWTIGKIVLPLGISFFTFTQIAYLVDAKRGVVCEYDLGDFLLFITFFPHLIAGPIIHHREMMPQFAEPRTYRFDWENLAVGLGIFSIGLFKKVVIADALSGHVGKVFDAAAAGTSFSASDAWAGVLCYTFQIYFDFSGYSDMAIALARMFGITLPLNFNSPYQAVNMVEFWRRWHMTLSRFLRDYLYIPLGGNRRGPLRRYLNLILTMVIGGLWHGAAWTFVLWGFLHGLCLAVNHLWSEFWAARPTLWRWPAWMAEWSGRSITFLLVVLGWVFFRAVNLNAAEHILEAMFGMSATVPGAPALLKPKLWVSLAALLGFVWLLPNAARLMQDYQPYPAVTAESPATLLPWQRWRMTSAWACFAALLLAVAALSLSRAGEFLYYNF